MSRPLSRILTRFVFIGLTLSLMVSGFPVSAEADDPPRAVSMATAVSKDVPLRIKGFGFLKAFSEVEIKSQVFGQLMQVHFQEGDMVEEGDLLFTVDEEQYRDAVNQAAAAVNTNRAELASTKDMLRRYVPLDKEQVVAVVDLVDLRYRAEGDAAKLKEAQAALASAKVNLKHCTILAPISGRTGIIQVKPGNLVSSDEDTALVIITDEDPLHVDFDFSEKYFPRINRYMRNQTLKVQVQSPYDGSLAAEGNLTFVNNVVTAQTGTIRLRGTFPNPDGLFRPGQYVEVQLILRMINNATTIPYAAIQLGSNGEYVFRVLEGNKVEHVEVVTSERLDDTVVVTSGLKPGDKVVTSGKLGLSNGTTVFTLEELAEEKAAKEKAAEEKGKDKDGKGASEKNKDDGKKK